MCSKMNKHTKNKTPEINLHEIEISDLPQREFKIMAIKMSTEVRRIMHEQIKNFNKKVESIIKYQTEITDLKNMITEPANSVERLNDRPGHTEERISKLKEGAVEFIQSEGQKGKRINKSEERPGWCGSGH